MKKLVSLLLALMMCASLAACDSGLDRQPAIDAHNKAGEAINAVSDIINQNPEAYADYIVDMQELIDTLNQCGSVLQNNDDLDQDALDEWVKVCGDIEEWAKAAKTELEG